jgi:hypothetical protein
MLCPMIALFPISPQQMMEADRLKMSDHRGKFRQIQADHFKIK